MKVSIVTISFNQAQFLERAMQSVIDQDHSDVEYIVVDPGSTDGSRKIIDRYCNSIHKVILEMDKGPADGLNRGFAEASGEVFGFINADDALLPGSMRYVADYFQSNPSVDVLLGAGYLIDNRDERLRPILPTPFSVRRYVTGGFEFIQQSMFFRRSAFYAVNGFNSENLTCWDGELLLDMGMAGKRISTCMKNLGLFRWHDDSISGSGRLNEAYARDRNRLFRKAMGRSRNSFDKVIGVLYRVEKWRAHPWFYGKRFVKHGHFRSQEK